MNIFILRSVCFVMEMFSSSFKADGCKGNNEEGDGEEMKNFNEDILCYHGLC